MQGMPHTDRIQTNRPEYPFSPPGVLDFPCGIDIDPDGTVLITDAGSETGEGSELLEVDSDGRLLRRWDLGFDFLHGVKRLKNGTIILADTTNDRILEIDDEGEILFTSDEWDSGGGRLSDGSRLSYPNNVHPFEDGERFMVTDRNNNRFVVVDRTGTVYRQFDTDLRHPHNCEPLSDGNVLIADSDNDAVIEVGPNDEIVWRYDTGLQWPRDANRLENGNTLIADSRNSRVIEVSPEGETVWEFTVDYFGNFYEAHRMADGTTYISDQQHKRVIRVDTEGRIIWEFRNFVRDTPILPSLKNGMFKKRTQDGRPEGWFLDTRFSEGGGRLFWSEDERGRPVPGLEFDRTGALCLRQTVQVTPGTRYTLGGAVRTESQKSGFACLQAAFLDDRGGLLCDAAKAPRGMVFAQDTDWTQDSLEVVVPDRAVAVDIRLFLTGQGRALFKQVRFFA